MISRPRPSPFGRDLADCKPYRQPVGFSYKTCLQPLERPAALNSQTIHITFFIKDLPCLAQKGTKKSWVGMAFALVILVLILAQTKMNFLKSVLTTAVLTGAALSAAAAPVTFDFYKLGRGVANGDFLPTDGISATGGDLASSDVNNGTFNGDLTFTTGGLTAKATGTYFGSAAAAVVQDQEGGWTSTVGAGLGVYHIKPVDNSDDNITLGEVLTITFNQTVNLSAIGLRADGHNITGWTTGDKFLFNGVQTTLPDNVGSITGLNLTGTTFTFGFDPSQALSAQFYLASMTVSAVPEGGLTLAMLGSSVLGFFMLRRRFSK